MSQPISKVLAALGGVFLILLGMVALWALRAGGSAGLGQLLTTGRISELQPALFQSAPLRTDHGGADRVYLLSTQSETVTGVAGRRSNNRPRRDLLHVDLWAIDANTATSSNTIAVSSMKVQSGKAWLTSRVMTSAPQARSMPQ